MGPGSCFGRLGSVVDASGGLLDLLPVGEWRDVSLLRDPGGMMAGHGWAVLASARWLRGGGREAFIKYLLPATDQASSTTQAVVGPERLARLAARLRVLALSQQEIPVVELLEVREVAETGGLLIAMERVSEVRERILEGRAGVDLALRVLELFARARSATWFHFDICPRNLGVRSDGSLVLIDVESVYLCEGTAFVVTTPAWKIHRAPLELAFAINGEYSSMAPELALKKMRFEALLVAGECVFGLFGGKRFEAKELEEWIGGRDAEPAMAVLASALRSALVTDVPHFTSLIDELRAASKSGSAGSGSALPTTIKRAAFDPNARATDLDAAPSDLDAQGRALRAGGLTLAQLKAYRERLVERLAQAEGRRAIWDELLFVAISYEKDPEEARRLVLKALKEFGDDLELRKLRQMIDTWCAGRGL